MKAIIIWGSQLTIEHHSALHEAPDAPIVLIESRNMSSRYKYHKQKLRFVLTAMREYADELHASGRTVWYSQMNDAKPLWFDELQQVCKQYGVTELIAMRQNDHTPQQKLEAWCREQNIVLRTTPNTMFLTPTSLFNEWAEQQSRLQRIRNGQHCIGSSWSAITKSCALIFG